MYSNIWFDIIRFEQDSSENCGWCFLKKFRYKCEWANAYIAIYKRVTDSDLNVNNCKYDYILTIFGVYYGWYYKASDKLLQL